MQTRYTEPGVQTPPCRRRRRHRRRRRRRRRYSHGAPDSQLRADKRIIAGLHVSSASDQRVLSPADPGMAGVPPSRLPTDLEM